MENYANYKQKQLSYTVDEQYFKDNDYTYQELFAMEIPYYHKKFDDYHIWCNVDTKEVFVDDLYGFLTPTVLKFYIANKSKLKKSKTFDDYEYLAYYLNRKTGEIVTKDDAMSEFKGKSNWMDLWFDSKYITDNSWTEKVFIKRICEQMIDEINWITDDALN